MLSDSRFFDSGMEVIVNDRTLKISVKCGDKTCYSEHSKPCEFVRVARFGSVYFCQIWEEADMRGHPLPLKEEGGWLMRCQACLDAEEDETDE